MRLRPEQKSCGGVKATNPKNKRERASAPKSRRLSRRSKEMLIAKVHFLKDHLKQLEEQDERLTAEIEKAPMSDITYADGRHIVVRMSDPELVRMSEDTGGGEICRCKQELTEAEFMLSPPKGHPPDRIYRLALRDRESQPTLTVTQLAQKYLPHYFPGRSNSAVRMMDEGLRRARKRKQTPSQ